jgi:hypothetical protein
VAQNIFGAESPLEHNFYVLLSIPNVCVCTLPVFNAHIPFGEIDLVARVKVTVCCTVELDSS